MKRIVSFFGDITPTFEMLNRQAEAYAAELGFEYQWAPQIPFNQSDVVEKLNHADAGVIDVEPYGEEIFSTISAKLLVRFGVGYDKVDLASATRHGIAVARTTGANTMGVAEMALTLLLAARRELASNIACVRNGEWVKNVSNETVGATIGILGFGAIGRALAGLLRGFGSSLIAYDPFPDEEAGHDLGVRFVGLDELFETADAISVHAPYSPETHHLVNAERLAKMKSEAVIVNTARGGIVDTDALYDALKAKRIRGAGLDVYAIEPLPVSSKLLELDNIVLTPHVSSQTVESLWRIYKMAIDIAADFFAGRGSPHILNPEFINSDCSSC